MEGLSHRRGMVMEEELELNVEEQMSKEREEAGVRQTGLDGC